MASGPLVGTWRLLSFELRMPDGTVSHPYGENVTGYLVYSDDGFMCAAFGSSDRGAESAGDLAEAGAAANYEQFMSYSGPYEVEGDRIRHKVEVSSLQVWTGTVQERVFEIENGRLSLVTMPLQVASEAPTAHLIWDRAAGAAAEARRPDASDAPTLAAAPSVARP